MTDLYDDNIRQESDGTWTVIEDDFVGLAKPIKGLTEAQARQVAEALWNAEQEGRRHGMSDF